MPTDDRSSPRIFDPRYPVALGVGVFGGISAFPLRIAERHGVFGRHGIAARLTVTPSSDALLAGLLAGTYQVVHAAPDNAVAWSDRGGVPVDVWIGGSNGLITLISRRCGGVSSLRGARIGVDSPMSGFAPVLRRLLDDAGVPIDQVELVEVGATRLRAAALRDGLIDATTLSLPWSALAAREGAKPVADHRTVAPRMLTSSGCSLRSWLTAESDVPDRYLAALREALDLVADPSERDAMVDALAADLDVDSDLAADILELMLGPDGWPRDAAVDPAGFAVVCALRTEVLGAPLRSPDSYIDHGPARRVAAHRDAGILP